MRFRPHDPHNRPFEPSLLDLIAAVEQAPELSEQRRRHWVCSLAANRQMAGPSGRGDPRPLAGRYGSPWGNCTTRASASRPKRWRTTSPIFGRHSAGSARSTTSPQQGVRLSTEWARFRDRLDDRIRDRLYSLMRYCSARRIGPSAVDDEIFDEYWRYRAQTTGRACNNTARRFMVRAWNASAGAIDGCSLRQLTEPPLKVAEPAWDAFPEGLRRDLDDYFAGLAKPHRTLNGKRIQPCSRQRSDPPAGRAGRDGAHGSAAARRADREPDLFGHAAPP